jgi:hypothetical protein
VRRSSSASASREKLSGTFFKKNSHMYITEMVV